MSTILSTEDHSELMQSIANKTSSQFFHIPPVPTKSSEKSRDEDSQNGEVEADRIFRDDIGRPSKKITISTFKKG